MRLCCVLVDDMMIVLFTLTFTYAPIPLGRSINGKGRMIWRIRDEITCSDGAAIAVSKMKQSHRSVVASDANAVAVRYCE
jgi:hypothetical protein